MRASRLLSILMMLQLRGRLTAEFLAESFEVSVRTVYRDIDELSAAGVPVYADRGPGGGFQLLDGYRTRLTGLAAGEAAAMVMIGMPGAAEALGLGPDATMAAHKLLAAMPASQSAEAGRIWERFHHDPLGWYRAADPVAQLPRIAEAVWREKVIAMTYKSWAGVRDWRVEPLGLVIKAGDWYLVARGGRDNRARIFKVSSIAEYAISDDDFARPADFDLAGFWAAEMVRFEADLRPQTAKVRVSAPAFVRFRELGAYAAQALDSGKGDTERIVDLPVENTDQAARLLLGFGADVEVLAPPELRQRIRMLALEIAALYIKP